MEGPFQPFSVRGEPAEQIPVERGSAWQYLFDLNLEASPHFKKAWDGLKSGGFAFRNGRGELVVRSGAGTSILYQDISE